MSSSSSESSKMSFPGSVVDGGFSWTLGSWMSSFSSSVSLQWSSSWTGGIIFSSTSFWIKGSSKLSALRLEAQEKPSGVLSVAKCKRVSLSGKTCTFCTAAHTTACLGAKSHFSEWGGTVTFCFTDVDRGGGGGGVLLRLGGIVCPGLSGRSLGLIIPLTIPLHGSLCTELAMEWLSKTVKGADRRASAEHEWSLL